VANLTISVDEAVLRRARLRALEQHTSVNAVLREQLELYADDSASERASRAFLALAHESRASSGAGGRSWTRDELYVERDKRA